MRKWWIPHLNDMNACGTASLCSLAAIIIGQMFERFRKVQQIAFGQIELISRIGLSVERIANHDLQNVLLLCVSACEKSSTN